MKVDTETRRQIMRRGHQVAKQYRGDYAARISGGLSAAWLERKAMGGTKETNKIKPGGCKMVTFNMCERIIECLAPAYARVHKIWAKKLTGVNVSKSNGFAFEGEFLPCKPQLQDIPIVDGDIVLMYGDFGSVKNHEPEASIFRFDGENFEQIGKKVIGRDWAIKLRQTASEALNRKDEYNPMKKFSDEEILEEAKRRGLI